MEFDENEIWNPFHSGSIATVNSGQWATALIHKKWMEFLEMEKERWENRTDDTSYIFYQRLKPEKKSAPRVEAETINSSDSAVTEFSWS